MRNDKLITEKLESLIISGQGIATGKLAYSMWRYNTISLFTTIFGEKHPQTKQFEKLSKIDYDSLQDKSQNEILCYYIGSYNLCVEFISNIIEQINTFGTTTVIGSERSLDQTAQIFNINQNQSQNQQQSQSITFEVFLDVIKSELDENQQKELKKVLVEYQTTNNFVKVTKYFKTLGDNVLANLISTVILNPSVVSQIINNLHI